MHILGSNIGICYNILIMDNGTTTPIKNQEPAKKGRKGLKIGVIIGVSLLSVIVSILVASSFFKPAPPESRPQPTPAESSNEKKDDEALARAIEPCALLTDAERAKFNLGIGEADDKHLRGWHPVQPCLLHTDRTWCRSVDDQPQTRDVGLVSDLLG